MNGTEADQEKTLFRAATAEAIKNSHSAVKACWTILFTGGTFALLNSFDRIVECKVSGHVSNFDCKELEYLDGANFLVYLALIAVYILTFYRFYVGNIRLFDIRYDEVFKFISNLAKEKPESGDKEFDWLFDYNDQWKKSENIYLIVKTLVIIYLTVAITKPLKFEIVYSSLLVMDILWILIFRRSPILEHTFRQKFSDSFENFRSPTVSQEIVRDLDMVFPTAAMKVWRWNNILCGAALLLLVIPLVLNRLGIQFCALAISPKVEEGLLIVGLGVMLINCLVDLGKTWGFYNPRYGKLNRYLFPMDSQGRNAPPRAAGSPEN